MALLPTSSQPLLGQDHVEVPVVVTGQDVPLPPPMQIVTKGWWNRPVEYATAEELEKADHERRYAIEHGKQR